MGTVFEIKRFAVHDGPGIRTTLFIKGCPLHCPWCQNPEGLNAQIRLWHKPTGCLLCGSCAASCPAGALTISDCVRINRDSCQRCGKCIQACPVGALSMDGWEINAEEAASLLMKDKVFFEDGGGITLSGGEIFVQWRFALDILKICKENGINTAIESCMSVSTEILCKFLPVVDHFIMDIKYMDPNIHRDVLGMDNRQILDNHAWLVARGADVLVRTPLIPGYTATEDNIRAIARYLAQTDPNTRYELLNFNPLCRSKYAALEQDYPVEGSMFTAQQMEGFYEILRQEGIRNIIRE